MHDSEKMPVEAQMGCHRPRVLRRADLEARGLKRMGVCEYVPRSVAKNDANGKTVKVKWVRINTGSEERLEVRCRLIAYELGFGERLD